MAAETTQPKEDPQIKVTEVSPESKESQAKEDPAPSRVGRAESIVRRNVLWALGLGVIPIPIFDLVAITGVQVKMISELSTLYGVKFREDIVKKLISSLLSGVAGVGIGAAIGTSLLKFIPPVGTALGIVSIPVTAGAFTHATGKVFIMHFESGGTLLDFDAHKMRAYFKEELERAKEVVTKVQEEESRAQKPS